MLENYIIPSIPLLASLTVYGYYIGVLKREVDEPNIFSHNNLPPISIVFAARNEIDSIGQRISNIAETGYPNSNIELVIVNDCSTDDTAEIALRTAKSYGIDVRVLHNRVRMGVNYSMKKGIEHTRNEVVVCTDADVFFDKKSLEFLVSALIEDDEVGAVTGDLRPYHGEELTKASETSYRSIYGRMCVLESRRHATYCFNGALYAIKKEAITNLDMGGGAFDAGIALEVIRNRYKTKYVPQARVYEKIPDNFFIQIKQKIRRAGRLIKATQRNLDLIKLPGFRGIMFTRSYMFLIAPTLFVTGLIGLIAANPLILILLVIALTLSRTVFMFTAHQIYLLAGLFYNIKDTEVW